MSRHSKNSSLSGKHIVVFLATCILAFVFTYIGVDIYQGSHSKPQPSPSHTASTRPTSTATQSPESEPEPEPEPSPSDEPSTITLEQARARLNMREDYRPAFNHGTKTAQHQKYIVLHDTEVDSSAAAIANSWQSQGTFVAAHFIVQKDGTILQVVPMDAIAHHAGFGDTGHNALYGVSDESRDDRRGTQPIGSWASDYGMNSYSIGIEMVHVSGSGYYPPEQLEAVDNLIAYIDAYYGFESQIIDHKAWRSGNSDTSPEFAGYLANYKDHRTHN